jgi:hypothetical protein
MKKNGACISVVVDRNAASGRADSALMDVNAACTKWLRKRGLMEDLRDVINRSASMHHAKNLAAGRGAYARTGGEKNRVGEESSARSLRLSDFMEESV